MQDVFRLERVNGFVHPGLVEQIESAETAADVAEFVDRKIGMAAPYPKHLGFDGILLEVLEEVTTDEPREPSDQYFAHARLPSATCLYTASYIDVIVACVKRF